MKRNKNDVTLICNQVKDKIMLVYSTEYIDNKDYDKDYIELKLPQMRLREDLQENDEIYGELVEDLWWMKFYDRTFFIVKPDLWIGIKNKLSDEEQWNIINKYKEDKPFE